MRSAVGGGGEFGAPLALNVIPWAGSLRPDGWSSEELKIRNETRKILGAPDLRISATCVRVPVVVGHSLALHAVFEAEVDADQARKLLSEAPGVVVSDRPEAREYPMPVAVAGTDPTVVGRIRKSMDDPHALDLFVCGDNLRKGAALNAARSPSPRREVRALKVHDHGSLSAHPPAESSAAVAIPANRPDPADRAAPEASWLSGSRCR